VTARLRCAVVVTWRVTCLRRLDDWDTSCTERRWRRRSNSASIVAVINNPRRCSILTPCHRRWSHRCTSRACPQQLLCRQSHRRTTPNNLCDDVIVNMLQQFTIPSFFYQTAKQHYLRHTVNFHRLQRQQRFYCCSAVLKVTCACAC